MMLNVKGILYSWYNQVSQCVENQYDHVDPQYYAVGLVICIGLGWVLLRGRS